MGFSTRTRNALLNSMLGKTSDFGTVASGQVTTANDLEFATATADWDEATDMRLYDAASSGNEIARAAIINTGSIDNFVADAGTDTLTVPNHSFVDDDTVRVSGESLPTGIDADTTYYVVSAAADTLQLSASQGGAAINLTGDGWGEIAKTAYKTVQNGDTAKFAAGSLTLKLV